KLNITKENVFLAQVDDNKQLTVDLYDDQLPQPESTELPMLLVTLEKTAADLKLFSLATENPHSKHLYELNYERLQEVIRLTNHLKHFDKHGYHKLDGHANKLDKRILYTIIVTAHQTRQNSSLFNARYR